MNPIQPFRDVGQSPSNEPASGTDRTTAATRSYFVPDPEKAFQMPDGRYLYNTQRKERTWLCTYTPFSNADSDRLVALHRALGREPFQSKEEEACYGSLLGLVIGDAIGVPYAFAPWSESAVPKHFYRLLPGQWTACSSMALCLADSLILKEGEFNPVDLRLRMLNAETYGYNSPFGSTAGIDPGVLLSLKSFLRNPDGYSQGDSLSKSSQSGMMRMAPVAIRFHRDTLKTTQIGYMQSKTTHATEEPAECARLVGYLISRAIRGEFNREDSALKKLEDLLKGFESPLDSVKQLALGEGENALYCRQRGLNPADRLWNWKEPAFQFAESRMRERPYYIGQYCMDCLAMALHCIATTDCFQKAVVKAATRGGDACALGAVTGEIAGALYGASAIPLSSRESILNQDTNHDIPLRVHRLM